MTPEMAWQVPVSSARGLAHYMELSDAPKMVMALCEYGPFNTAYAQIIPHAKFCLKCQDSLIRSGE